MSKPIKKNKWTSLDAFGLLNGLSTWSPGYLELRYVRLPNDTNLQLRRKINNMRRNPVTGNSPQDIINGMNNELDLEPYNVTEKSSFDLSRQPWPSGNIDVQDIWVYYQPPNETGWYNVVPQLWASGCETTPKSGFIVWEDSYFQDGLTGDLKTHNYSQLLTIYNSGVPDNSKVKTVYYARTFSIDNVSQYNLYTDMPTSDNDDTYIYRTPYTIASGDLLNKIVAYNLDDVPNGLSGFYYNEDGSAKGKLYKIRDIINKNYRHKWKDIRDNETVWDVHKQYSYGTIPSFYDTSFTVPSGQDYRSINFNGGIESKDTSLYFKDISVQLSGDIEYWYPIIEPGKFYCSGVPYLLMENPQKVDLDLSTGSVTMPSGIERWHSTVLATSGYFPSSNDFIYEYYNYLVPYKETSNTTISGYVGSVNIFRKRPYLTESMGYNLAISSGEYCIDYSNETVYSSGLSDCTLVWDDVIVPSGRICDTIYSDLNPFNDDITAYNKYFFTLGE